ncbi:MAG TPA: hypothetical protein DCY03_07700, partial [Planctomycetaceae bacterium]|nr:hypothetical protein [Planctomycetaceae bacterium]
TVKLDTVNDWNPDPLRIHGLRADVSQDRIAFPPERSGNKNRDDLFRPSRFFGIRFKYPGGSGK